jgi:uncharacterized protein
MSIYKATVPQFKNTLTCLDGFIEKGIAYAEQKKFDPERLSVARLAPDQYSFARQVQAACDAAKLGVYRLTEKRAPSHPDGEAPLSELRARIQSVIEYLNGVSEKDFEGAKDREIRLPILDNKAIAAGDYLNQWVLPNFYFHVTSAYAILRHNGVMLDKMDYLGQVNATTPGA